jgi:hypothetical protein
MSNFIRGLAELISPLSREVIIGIAFVCTSIIALIASIFQRARKIIRKDHEISINIDDSPIGIEDLTPKDIDKIIRILKSRKDARANVGTDQLSEPDDNISGSDKPVS